MKEYRHPDDSVETCLHQLQGILNAYPTRLKGINEAIFSSPPAPGKWSRKQIIGHLIDSATNNHQRFVRGQFEDKPAISYNQEDWNQYSYYSSMDSGQLIGFWEMYNRHLVELIKRIPPDLMQRECTMSDESTWSIAKLFEDYVRHLEHHLRQVFDNSN